MRYTIGNSRCCGEIEFACGNSISAKLSHLRDVLVAHGFKKSRAVSLSKRAMGEKVNVNVPLDFDKLKSCGILAKPETVSPSP